MKENEFISMINQENEYDENDKIYSSIWKEYEKVVYESLITSFGLDFIIEDTYGGDVDTIHNVREIANDPRLDYKNTTNKFVYANRGEYDTREYHQHEKYKEINAEISKKRKEGKLIDAYTGKRMSRNSKSDLDHIISAKEIHDDPGRVLAGIKGKDLANCRENLKPTDSSINRSMKDKNIEDYLIYLEETKTERKDAIGVLKGKEQLTKKEKNQLHKLEELDSVNYELANEQNKKARENYNQKINRQYYIGKSFTKDLSKAACTRGIQMGSRQIIGCVFAEVWVSTNSELQEIPVGCDFKEIIDAIIRGIRIGIENAKNNYKELLNRFFQGATAGILASISNTLCNIFFTTSRNFGKCIRNMYASLTEAGRVLFFNPEDLLMGDRIKNVSVIMATGASVLVGSIVGQAISETPIGMLPGVGEVIQTFIATLVTGMLSCSFLIMLDRSIFINEIIDTFNNVPNIATSYIEVANLFTKISAEIAKYDIEQFEKEVENYKECSLKIMNAKDENELQQILYEIHENMDFKIPWEGSFASFMEDKESKLVFE